MLYLSRQASIFRFVRRNRLARHFASRFVAGETVESACRREVLEETGVPVSQLALVGVYSDPERDPRGHTVSIAYATRLSEAASPRPGSDAENVEWIKDWRGLALAFDHAKILADAERALGGWRSRL